MQILLINGLIITFVIVYIVRHSGFINDLSKFIYNLTHQTEWKYQMIGKPFGCYGCLTFWTILIMSLFSQSIIVSLGLASSFSIIAILIDKLISITINLINKL